MPQGCVNVAGFEELQEDYFLWNQFAFYDYKTC